MWQPVVVVLLVAAVAVLLLRRVNFSGIAKREAGEPADYQALVAEVGLEIADDAHYQRARSKANQLWAGDRELSGNNTNPLLNLQQINYMHDLRDAVHAYATLRPWLFLDDEEKLRITSVADEVDRRVRHADRLIRQHGLKYAEAIALKQHCTHVAAECRDLANGTKGPAEDEMQAHVLGYMLEEAESRLSRAIQDIDRATLILAAEAQGHLLYEESVRSLLRKAAHAKELTECERLLRQAVLQAENPDADKDELDLIRATQALALVCHEDLGKLDEAETLYLKVLALGAPDTQDEVVETLACLTRLYGQQKRIAEAQAMSDRVVAAHVARGAAANLGSIVSSLHVLGHAYGQSGNAREEEACYRKALACAEQHDSDWPSPMHTAHALKRLVIFLTTIGRFREAAGYYDRMVVAERGTVASFESPENLRLFAGMLDKVNRRHDAETLRQRATRRDEERAAVADEAASIRYRFNNSFHWVWERRWIRETMV